MNYYNRVKFKPGEQKKFIELACSKCNLSIAKLAKVIRLHPRSLRDWKREKFSMSFPAVNILCKKANIKFPSDIVVKEPFWYTANGSLAGAKAVLEKYGYIGGDQEYRKKKWFEWWDKKGKFSKNEFFKTRKIIYPPYSEKLAECIGIIIGDGSITKRQVVITLNKDTDKLYANYVIELIRRLFKIKPSVYTQGSVYDITVSRTELVNFLLKIGLRMGNKVKNQIEVPEWIQKDEKYSKACIKGLVDTDGSFFIEKHPYKNKINYNCVVNLTNRSLPVLKFFKAKLVHFGFKPRQNNKTSVCLGRKKEVDRYFQEIGTSNPKHRNKHLDFTKNGGVPKWS